VRIGHAVYNALLPAAALAARAASLWNGKIAEGLAGRRGLRERWVAGAAKLRRTSPLAWFHVSSVGEFEQAKPVMSLLAERPGGIEIALTFYSPSGMSYYRRFDRSKRIDAVGFFDYLPFDTPDNARFCLDTLRPDILVYVKFDIWPNLVVEASKRGVPQALVAGTLSPGSMRLSRIARGFYGDLYSRLGAIAAISEEDADRFRRDARGAVEIVVAGDTRFDQVCRRIDASTVTLPGGVAAAGRTWIVAGSTWPKDEALVVSGYRALRKTRRDVGLILVPHEPSAARLAAIRRALASAGLPCRLLSSLGDEAPEEEDVVVADGVGYLAELYRAGRIAYVGGSFTTGVHNVMEPAVLSLPVFFGPRIDNSYEARRLVELGAAKIVRTGIDFAREADALLEDPDRLERAGAAGSRFIRNHCGAAPRCVDLLETLLAGNR
jgi:3-deoxy-D-manno-octulosonic-acid transferase